MLCQKNIGCFCSYCSSGGITKNTFTHSSRLSSWCQTWEKASDWILRILALTSGRWTWTWKIIIGVSNSAERLQSQSRCWARPIRPHSVLPWLTNLFVNLTNLFVFSSISLSSTLQPLVILLISWYAHMLCYAAKRFIVLSLKTLY